MNEYGFTAKYVAGLISNFYQLPGCGVGGPLHSELDDNNLETVFLDETMKEIIQKYEWVDRYYEDWVISAALVLGWVLRQCTMTQRTKANTLSLANRYPWMDQWTSK